MPELDAAAMDSIFANFNLTNLPLTTIGNSYTVEELIRAFTRQRELISEVISGLDDEQVNYNPAPGEFSVSEIVSHITTAQNGPYNALLELSQIVLPFVDHVRFMPGEGAKKHLSAAACRDLLTEGTDELSEVMRQTGRIEDYQPKEYPVLGLMSPKAWMLFQLGHDLDHLRQMKQVLLSEGFPKHSEVVTPS